MCIVVVVGDGKPHLRGDDVECHEGEGQAQHIKQRCDLVSSQGH